MTIETAYQLLPMVAAVMAGFFVFGSVWNYFVAPRLMRKIVGSEAWALLDDDLCRSSIAAIQYPFALFRI